MPRSILLLLVCWTGAAAATPSPSTLTWGAQEDGSTLCRADGTPLPVGLIVRLGYFDLTPEQVRLNAENPSFLNGHFHVLAETRIGSFESQTFVGFPALSTIGVSYPEAQGSFAASVIFTPSLDAAGLDGKRCYVWAMDAASVANSTQFGVFSDSSWVLNLSAFGATQWDLSQVSNVDPEDVLVGTRSAQSGPPSAPTVLRLMNTSPLLTDGSDPDHDGVVGLLETAFAMDPAKPDAYKLPHIAIRDGRNCLEFQRKSGGNVADGSYVADGLRYTVEISADLRNWHTQPVNDPAVVTVTPGETAGVELASVALDSGTGSTGSQFARVRVERVP